VYSATQTSEHASKFVDSPYIRLLTWSRGAIEYLLARKLETLHADYMVEPDSRSVAGWLGLDVIENGPRRVTEALEPYLLRHTRLLPRDLVLLGNRLSAAVAGAKISGRRGLTAEEVKDTVSRTARIFGREQITICSNQISAKLMPVLASLQGYEGIFTGEGYDENLGLHAHFRRQLRAILGRTKVDRFDETTLDTLDSDLRNAFEGIDVLSVLWQNGLLGYSEESVLTGPTVFYQAAMEDDLELPRGRPGYVLHPTMIDAVDGLQGVGSPVEPAA
jgi:hypothetical protein